ncbi:MAG: hypothetical protein IT290_06110, partial [Deltaproteobacteria bacterium]|nr:hypothetical protein [Deltaproteobacteria bacterium]
RRSQTALRRKRINPYVTRVQDFPGRLFSFSEVKAELDEIRELAREKRVIVELGSGSGGHLLERAAREPDARFFGFELRYKRVFRTIEKAIERGITNVYALQTDARFAASIFTPASVCGIYMNFPEPWDRRRWAKHRLMRAELLDSASTMLCKGGFLAVKSDHKETFLEFAEALEQDTRWSVAKKSLDLHSTPLVAENVTSEFERMFVTQNLPIHFIEATTN